MDRVLPARTTCRGVPYYPEFGQNSHGYRTQNSSKSQCCCCKNSQILLAHVESRATVAPIPRLHPSGTEARNRQILHADGLLRGDVGLRFSPVVILKQTAISISAKFTIFCSNLRQNLNFDDILPFPCFLECHGRLVNVTTVVSLPPPVVRSANDVFKLETSVIFNQILYVPIGAAHAVLRCAVVELMFRIASASRLGRPLCGVGYYTLCIHGESSISRSGNLLTNIGLQINKQLRCLMKFDNKRAG
jgi:hypothetical protein